MQAECDRLPDGICPWTGTNDHELSCGSKT